MKKILIVDDSTFTRNSLKKQLLENNYAVLSAANGLEALKVLETDFPDLIITDLNMPEMDGISLLEKLKTDGNSIPILVLTADIQDTSMDKCIALGAKNVIHKQFNQSLISNIKNLLREPAQ